MLRIKSAPLMRMGDSTNDVFELNTKFGASLREAKSLLKYGRKIGSKFVGIRWVGRAGDEGKTEVILVFQMNEGNTQKYSFVPENVDVDGGVWL